MASPRITAATRLQRLLAILQWVAGHGDRGVSYGAVAERFGLAEKALADELSLASMVGADSMHYDEMPFEVLLDDDRVAVRLFSFQRPMRLTSIEGLALVAAADALLGEDPPADSPLSRALVKLSRLLQITPGVDLDVDVDVDGGAVGRILAVAIDEQKQVRFEYWSYGRDVVSERRVEPWWVFAAEGAWYLVGLDTDAHDDRRFRLDRIGDIEVLDRAAAPAPATMEAADLFGEDAPRVTLDLPADARWVAETFPVDEVLVRDDGRLRVRLPVYSRSWLQRQLLRLGRDAQVVSADGELGEGDLLAEAASSVLTRYEPS